MWSKKPEVKIIRGWSGDGHCSNEAESLFEPFNSALATAETTLFVIPVFKRRIIIKKTLTALTAQLDAP